MRAFIVIATSFALLVTLPTAGAVYINATWEKNDVDFDEKPIHTVETRIHLITHCFTIIDYPAAVTLATDAPGVLFFYDDREIQQHDLVEFEWELALVPTPHLYVDETFDMKIVRDPNVTEPIDTQQRWLYWGISYIYDSCPFFESITLLPILYGEDVREYIHFSASGLDNSSKLREIETNSVENLSLTPFIYLAFMSTIAIVFILRRNRSSE